MFDLVEGAGAVGWGRQSGKVGRESASVRTGLAGLFTANGRWGRG